MYHIKLDTMKILSSSLKRTFVLIMLISSFSLFTFGQNYKLLNDVSFIEVSGTSTLHDWHVDGEEQSGFIKIEKGEKLTINELVFTVKAESLKSGKSSMDKNTYKALKTDKYKDITFTYVKSNSSVKKDDNRYINSVTGNITVSGVTKSFNLILEIIFDGDLLKINGKKDVLMTDFNIDPPKALLGTIKTGNEITITYKSVFIK